MYKVKVYDGGWVTMCEIVDGKWQDCTFQTKEEAEQALKDYRETWNKNGRIYEA